MKPTPELYDLLQAAFDSFNRALFNDELPHVVLTLQRKRGTRGYFHDEIFKTRSGDDDTIAEIALNPETFDRDEREILSTLAHEMVHLWQSRLGQHISRNGYHNREWAEKMLEIGLKPISFDQPGKMTGQRVSHEIVDGESFDRACASFLAEYTSRLKWFSEIRAKKGSSTKNKIKYTCPECGANVWGKPDMRIVCGVCEAEYACEQ